MTERPDLRMVLERYGAEIRSERREVQILCVIHEESRPSCSVNLDKGVIHCMSCGFGGDAFDIIKEKEGFDEFRAAVAFAEREFGFAAAKPVHGRGAREGRTKRNGFRPAFRNRVLS